EDTQAAADSIGSRAGLNSASGGANVNAIVGKSHLLVIAIRNGDWRSGGEASGVDYGQRATAGNRTANDCWWLWRRPCNIKVRAIDQPNSRARNKNGCAESCGRIGEVGKDHAGGGATAFRAAVQDESLRLTAVEYRGNGLVKMHCIGNGLDCRSCGIDYKKSVGVGRDLALGIRKNQEFSSLGTHHQT